MTTCGNHWNNRNCQLIGKTLSMMEMISFYPGSPSPNDDKFLNGLIKQVKG